ncbi:NUMOD4 motif-containing HNH endonuclease [Mycobacterium sp. 23]|uniref:NUMOD4 motif-containing HNH endonuclease n=1 Tax=Mycobacterium sp. 23 TaxID=3400424 RepID=UPI003AAD4F6A
MIENWKPVPEWEKLYEVSDLGNVRSLDRWVRNGGGGFLYRGRLLQPSVGKRGYLVVGLSDGAARTRAGVKVHRLVLAAFVGPLPDGMMGLHQNGNKLDNRLTNLRYGTNADNQYDSMRHGTHPWASKTHCPAGHEYSAENLVVSTRGDGREFRACRTCRRNHDAARRLAAGMRPRRFKSRAPKGQLA